MMSKEILSQAEIDALLKQGANEDSSNDEVLIDKYLSPFDQDALGEIGNISFGSASTALSTLLGLKVEITTPKVSAIAKQDLDKQFPTPHVAIHVEYTEGFKGVNLFVIKNEDAKIIANLMMGGNGTDIVPGELSEMDISAVQEAMNQMMGSAATSMSTIFNKVVNISPPGVDLLDFNNGQSENLPVEDILVLVAFRLKVGSLIDSTIMQLTNVPFAKDMVNMLLGNGDQSLEEPINEPEEIMVSSNVAYEPQQPVSTGHSSASYEHHSTTSNTKANVNVQAAQFSNFNTSNNIKNEDPNLGLLMDIPLQITVELGRTKKIIRDILELAQGSIIELDKLAGEPVDIFANNKLIAKGEVVVIDENFGVRVTDIISQFERVRKLQ